MQRWNDKTERWEPVSIIKLVERVSQASDGSFMAWVTRRTQKGVRMTCDLLREKAKVR